MTPKPADAMFVRLAVTFAAKYETAPVTWPLLADRPGGSPETATVAWSPESGSLALKVTLTGAVSLLVWLEANSDGAWSTKTG